MSAAEYACTVKPSDTLTVELDYNDGRPIVAFSIEGEERDIITVLLGANDARDLVKMLARHCRLPLAAVAA